MSGAVISANQSLKVNRAIGGGAVVNSNAYAIASYRVITAPTADSSSGNSMDLALPPVTMHYGPGQTVLNTFTTGGSYSFNGAAATSFTYTYTFTSGIEFINSP